MNVTFRVGKKEGDEALEKKFVEGASKRGMMALKGHRSVGRTRTAVAVAPVTFITVFQERIQDA